VSKILKTFGKAFATVLGTGVLGFLGIAEFYFKDLMATIQQTGLFGFLTLVFVCAFISLAFAIYKHRVVFEDKNENDIENDPSVYETLTANLNKMMSKKEYSEVTRIGGLLSRALWIAGEYGNRITIGNLVYEAACKNSDDTARAMALIDDIGWTYVLINNFNKAKTNILEGIKIAEDKPYWIAKGYRHLFNIELLQGDDEDHIAAANNWLDLACESAANISDPQQKAEMQDGIDYDKIELLIQEEKLQEAQTEAEKVLNMYKSRNDKERMAKLYSLLGKIAFVMEDYPKSTGHFLDGLTMAEKSNQKDEIIKNSMGLAVSKHYEGDISRSHNYLQECNNHLDGRRSLLIFWSVIQSEFDTLLNNQL
jgi:tetratricopeptide (TPR) repeat protein